MEVRTFPNILRPGIGQKPRREGQRPNLPIHSRHCPVLEAGNAAGYLIYPPLAPNESYHMEFLGEGRYRFNYFVLTPNGRWEGVVSVTITMPIAGVGMMTEDVSFPKGVPIMSRDAALGLMRSLVIPEDMANPTGAVALRGATNFQTSAGWDTLYMPIFNMIIRPVAPMLVVRVETDWYAHETEFRYVLEPGEGITAQHNIPVGQVLFVPREEITMRECTDEETAAIVESQKQFIQHKATDRLQTPYGMSYSPHYLRTSRQMKGQGGEGDKKDDA